MSRRVWHHRTLDRPSFISIVIPVKDEVENIAPLAREITETMTGTPWSWECIWVDDGSGDGTFAALRGQHAADPRHRFVRLDGHYGQSAALAAGFGCAGGELIVTLDGDGQNDPADIPRLVELLATSGADVVNGYRGDRRSSLTRKLSSRVANAFRNWVTGESVRDVGCSLRVFRSVCVENILSFKGMHRFLPTLMRYDGYDRMIEVPVADRPRLQCRSKYGIWNRMWVGLVDTLAVAWMGRRTIRPRIEEVAPARPEGAASRVLHTGGGSR